MYKQKKMLTVKIEQKGGIINNEFDETQCQFR